MHSKSKTLHGAQGNHKEKTLRQRHIKEHDELAKRGKHKDLHTQGSERYQNTGETNQGGADIKSWREKEKNKVRKCRRKPSQ